MTDVRSYIKKLRQCADLLEEITSAARETPFTAAKIRKTLQPAKQLHWTQRPENAAKLHKMTQRAARTRKANAHG